MRHYPHSGRAAGFNLGQLVVDTVDIVVSQATPKPCVVETLKHV